MSVTINVYFVSGELLYFKLQVFPRGQYFVKND